VFFEKYLARSDAAIELRVSAGLRLSSELRVLFVKSVQLFSPIAPLIQNKQKNSVAFSPTALLFFILFFYKRSFCPLAL